MYYLAMAPQFFGTIPTFLKSEGLTETAGWQRLVIEKPFGHDLASATELNEQLQKVFRKKAFIGSTTILEKKWCKTSR